MVAEGSREALEQLTDRLQQGFPGASVSEVVVVWSENEGGFGSFGIE